jgi:hypothetical protein
MSKKAKPLLQNRDERNQYSDPYPVSNKDICTTRICLFVKRHINHIVTKAPEDPIAQKEFFNAFYREFLDTYEENEICEFTRIDIKNKLRLWNYKDYTSLTEKFYNMFTFYVTTLCQRPNTCDYKSMKILQKDILVSLNKITLEELQNRLNDINPDPRVREVIINNNLNGPSAYLMDIAIFFNTAFDTFYSNAITSGNIETAINIVNYFLQIMVNLEKLAMNAAQNISDASAFTTGFGILNCYNNFLISAIGNKLATILNSLLLAVITIVTGAGVGYLAINDTLNDQFLLTTFARLYYYTQIAQSSSKATLESIKLGDIIKLYLIKTIPNLAKEKIDIAANTIRYYINKLAERTEKMTLEHTENVVKDITNITKFIEKAIPMINADNVITVENNEQILLMTPEDRASLESYLNDNAERAAAAAEENRKEGGPGQKEYGGGKKHKKSHKKRHQKTHKKQLKPKAKSHKKKNKPKSKSHKKK